MSDFYERFQTGFEDVKIVLEIDHPEPDTLLFRAWAEDSKRERLLSVGCRSAVGLLLELLGRSSSPKELEISSALDAGWEDRMLEAKLSIAAPAWQGFNFAVSIDRFAAYFRHALAEEKRTFLPLKSGNW